AGTDKSAIADFKKMITEYPQASKVSEIKEEDYHEQVTVGFEIAEGYNTSSIKSVQHALRKMEQDSQQKIKQKNRNQKNKQHNIKMISEYTQASKKSEIKEEDYHEQVTVGFEIAEGYNTSSIKSVQHALRKMEQDLQQKIKQKNRIQKDNRHIVNSNSWRITSP